MEKALEIFNTENIVRNHSDSIDDTPIDLRYSVWHPKKKGASTLPTLYFKETPSLRVQQAKSLVKVSRISYMPMGSFSHVLSLNVEQFPPSFANLLILISKDIDTLDDTGKLKQLFEKVKIVAKTVIPKHLGCLDFPQMRIDRFSISVIFFSKTIYSFSRDRFNSVIKDAKDIGPRERLSEIISFLSKYATVKRLRPEVNRVTFQENFISKTAFVTRVCPDLEDCSEMALFPFLHFEGDLIFSFEAENLTQAVGTEETSREEDLFQVASYIDKSKLENIEDEFNNLITKDEQILFTKSKINKGPELKDASTSLLDDL
ncbi:hypothetical protein DLEV_136 [Diachasmimorpha longicaudata entomopoxvirus]|uniref:Uncharacterized protein n=1 Tax=Diachasmimorpha longicaudata entomopoxvirus TaxID=109981 RepID=A0A7R5WUD2_9POXV|nr:hypothetical protein QKK69_gp136 [Diachasmimorpha longicaudata entomopoxvirus]AKS26427.1 hypothetical protein DLEV_136 [Diachasmimorpha longicaudata entomopoxvirus]